ncbi:aminoglycoside phosphotransferase family protein [Streptomyces sp. A5-4]|uniref:aminoglycoside phosphotransferase family protein n=1 Tax=Streptomyces sp. A5-4 TaxID=3384771 RepID=UPI003DA97DAC
MGSPPTAVFHASNPTAHEVYNDFVSEAVRHGEMTRGYHNRNFRVPLTEAMARLVKREPGVSVTVRLRAPEVLPVVVRTWHDESEILGAVHGALPHVPECLAKRQGTAVHSYVEGVPLSSVCQNGEPVDPRLIRALAGLLTKLVAIRREDLPKLPSDWPRDGHSRDFLRRLARLTDEQVRQPNWAEFGGLFAALGVHDDAMAGFAERVPTMVRRPFSLLHTDLHRDNLIVTYGGTPPLVCVDWELATYGDPLHDLATHLVRMQYPPSQQQEVEQAWHREMSRIRPEGANGLASDLRHYLDFERAQSVYPDVMRAARSLGDGEKPVGLDAATASVRCALHAARRPLRLAGVPGRQEIKRILYRWHAAHGGRSAEAPHAWPVRFWTLDGELSAGGRLPDRAVAEALAAEGAASAERVFKGTGHLNTVVQVGKDRSTVVVRRKLGGGNRREPCFLDEHVVLRAVEGLGGAVRAPRVLAMGVSELSDGFAVHSYEGPAGGLRPPNHPVHGLLPLEADDLVDQLGALVDLDAAALDPTMGHSGFYPWLSDRLVEMVGSLPKESLQLARVLGLPGAQRLKEILARHAVTPRKPVLLHGDLNPWNLVRGAGTGELIIIDWEMAMVGDPLYDLVRHLHLTPHRPEIRRRMVERWKRELGRRGADYVEGVTRDADIYRWIESVRSAYVDLDRLLTGESLEAPNVRRAVASYSMTLQAATGSLGLRGDRMRNPYLALALPLGDYVEPWQGPGGATRGAQ